MTADTDFAFDDLRPLSWSDAFPWLAGVAGSDGLPWWHEAIDLDIDPVLRHMRLAAISELAMERLTRWTIGQIFPGLAPDIELLQLTQLPIRALNALHRFNCPTSGQLMTITLDDMLSWRQVGVGTVDSILQTLAELATFLTTPIVTTAGTGERSSSTGASNLDLARLPGWMTSLVDDLNVISTWYSTVGLSGQALLGGPIPAATPDDVVKARQRLEALSASDILSADELELDVAGLFDDALGMINPRAAQILGDRLFADEPVTLDQLGQRLSVTRERVRQIEGKARGTMLSFISEEGPLAAVAEAARNLIGTIRPLDDVLALIPALGREVAAVGQPAWRVLDRLDDAYEIEDGWCVVPTMTAAITITHTQLQERADQYGVLRLDDLDLVQTSQPDRLKELTGAWLTHCGYIVDGDFVLTRTTSVGDYGAAVLAIDGSPLSTQEILDRFVFERSAGSLRNAMGIDGRFERVDRDRWALTEWGMERYGGIRSVIRELVARGSGRARLSDVVEYITERYSVTGSSVVAYAGAPPFMTKDGTVQLASADHGARKPPERTRRIFRRAGAWAYRVRITTEHLRGSGSVAPMAIATILELDSGETRQLESDLGPQAIAWTSLQPSFGTIRRFLMADDIAADTEVFLVIHDNGAFSFEQTRDLVDNPLVDALSLVGAPPTVDRETARRALAVAIRLPEDSPVTSVFGGYRERGDDDVAELVLSVREYLETGHTPQERSHSADVNDILDLL
jgi:hypothetical protein